MARSPSAGGAALTNRTTRGRDAATTAPTDELTGGGVRIRRGDIRYADLSRGGDERWTSSPDYIELVSSRDQVTTAVQRAVHAGKRVTVRSGGHCYEDFVDNADVQVIIDLSRLTEITFDTERDAFAVEPGATLGDVYATLFKTWGVTVPAGTCPSVAAGGHIVGGGYGTLNRKFGLCVDYLHAVEVVVVDDAGKARTVVATRHEADPNQDLWWAHTGGGGGNFGVVTRYWLRSHGAAGPDPSRLLPRPPASMWAASFTWPWSALTETSFGRLLRNYGGWLAANSDADSPYAGLFSRLNLGNRAAGAINLAAQLDGTLPDSVALLDDFVAAVNDGVGVTPVTTERQLLPWWRSTSWQGLYTDIQTARDDFKSAYMRGNFTDAQVAAYYRNLNRADFDNPGALVSIASYGGRTNTVPPEATATAQRDSIMKLLYVVGWTDPADDDTNIGWLRQLYGDVYAGTGGVPVPNDVTDGCFVNYCDTDLSDPAFNRSGVPWSTLYYKDNYPRLQRIKARWDPLDIFRHNQSIELPAS
jgi:hypothetical protein